MAALNNETETMRKARARASFDSEKLRIFIYEGYFRSTIGFSNPLTYASTGISRQNRSASPPCGSVARSLAFTQVIHRNGSDEKKRFWLPLVESGNINGTCAHAEVGHKAFSRGLETVSGHSSMDDPVSDTYDRRQRMMKSQKPSSSILRQ